VARLQGCTVPSPCRGRHTELARAFYFGFGGHIVLRKAILQAVLHIAQACEETKVGRENMSVRQRAQTLGA